MEILICNNNICVRTVVCQIMSAPSVDFLVVTDLPNVVRFFELLSIDNCRVEFFNSIAPKNPIELYQAKRRLKRLFSSFQVSHLYSYHQAFGGMLNYLIHVAHKRNIPITYYRVLGELSLPEAKMSLKKLKEKLANFLYYGYADFDILDRGGGVFLPKLSQKFFQRNNVSIEKYVINGDIIRHVGSMLAERLGFDFERKDVLLLTGSVIATGQVAQSDYERTINDIVSLLCRERIVTKCHPRFNDEVAEEKELSSIPSYIPIDFIMDNFNIVIGYNSTTLIDASRQGKVAISLIDMIPASNTERVNRWHDYFGGAGIKFPKNIDEFMALVSN